jgi:hypothetical protein
MYETIKNAYITLYNIHYIIQHTLHYTTYITLYNIHYIIQHTLHYTTCITLYNMYYIIQHVFDQKNKFNSLQ